MDTNNLKTTLYFRSTQDLWQYFSFLAQKPYRVSWYEKSITCDCSKEDIKKAVELFHALPDK